MFRVMLGGSLDIERIRSRLATRRIGRTLIHYDSITSTNERVWARSEEPGADGCVVFAEHQTAGRGRLGRAWQCPWGAGVMASVLLIDQDGALDGAALAMIAAIAGRDAVRSAAGVPVVIKWPNDLLINGRKTGGVLIESRRGTDGALRFVVGIGINCLQHRGHFTDDWGAGATSLDLEGRAPVDRTLVALHLLTELDRWLADSARWSRAELRDAWSTRSESLGRRIRLRHDGREYRGSVIDVDPNAALIVQLDAGGRRSFSAASTTVLEMESGV